MCKKTKTKLLKRKTIISMLTENPDIDLSPAQATQAFGLSMMTVAEESTLAPTEYHSLRFVEFLDMIGRAAQLKFDDTPMDHITPFPKKLYIVMEALLKAAELNPSMPDDESATESESDDEY
jgi:hypothetical protein